MDDLEDLYREIILDHYRSPRNRGELASPPAHRAEGFNPLCGDEIVLTVLVEDGEVSDVKFAGQGCSISQSSASLMSSAIKGKSVGEARGVLRSFKRMMTVDETVEPDEEPVNLRQMGELAALQGVVKFPVRIKCATLAWNTLDQALVDVGA
jgi:nitrogen fixation protein NifU and related proteins